MKTIDSSLHHHVVPPDSREPGPHPSLILLHGRGADEEDLLGLADAFSPKLFVIGVRAPFPFANGGGYTWYDAASAGAPDPDMFRSSCDALSTFLDDASASYPIDRKRIFLFGFSMGAAMAFALTLTRPHAFRGVLAHSGYIPEGTHLTVQWDALRGVDFFIAHGTDDPVIPVMMARRARQLLTAAKASLVYCEYPIGHQISEQSLTDAAAWLNDRLHSQEKT